jgi:hypothetical protein
VRQGDLRECRKGAMQRIALGTRSLPFGDSRIALRPCDGSLPLCLIPLQTRLVALQIGATKNRNMVVEFRNSHRSRLSRCVRVLASDCDVRNRAGNYGRAGP